MIKKVEYDLNYRIKGKKFIKRIEIDFVPYQRHMDYGELQSGMVEVQLKWNRIQMIEKPVEYIKTMKELKKEVTDLSDQIKIISNSGIVRKRFELLKEILIDNGYEEDEDLMSWTFWSNSVETKVVNEMLEMAISKDIDKKKVFH